MLHTIVRIAGVQREYWRGLRNDSSNADTQRRLEITFQGNVQIYLILLRTRSYNRFSGIPVVWRNCAGKQSRVSESGVSVKRSKLLNAMAGEGIEERSRWREGEKRRNEDHG